MLPTRQTMTQVHRAIHLKRSLQLAGRQAESGKKVIRKVNESLGEQGIQNPEYHRAPNCYVHNFKNHQMQMLRRDNVQNIRCSNPHYRWADFRRRMVYGI
ncbi:uncharacterized protein [Drosophila kikkawai]|uniref:Uncharacterized protein n=1 Tax=Drosophila kikkawai TaxID=30033 RepID=A0A6P4I0F1_DROKI|nr:uncharacterized protein LOC108074675 [Drosophila kikkawai]KAH8301679.1 hypothetical protein KR059_008472 [Drosophila kikkawai]